MNAAERAVVKLVLVIIALCCFATCARALAPESFKQATWRFSVDAQNYTVATVNSFYYGRVAKGTYYDYPVSYIVPDEIFPNGFQ